MKRFAFFIWLTLLSGIARSTELGISSANWVNGHMRPDTFVGDGTGTCVVPSRFVGEGTGTCAGSGAFVGEGTGTCVVPARFEAAVNDLENRNLREIRNLMRHAQSPEERKMVLDKVLSLIDTGKK